MGKISRGAPDEQYARFTRRSYRGRRGPGPAENNDSLRDSFWVIANHVVPRPASRRRRDETNRYTDDRRRHNERNFRTFDLPSDLRPLAQAPTARAIRERS